MPGAVASWQKLLKLNPNFPQKDQVEHMIGEAKQSNKGKKRTRDPKPSILDRTAIGEWDTLCKKPKAKTKRQLQLNRAWSCYAGARAGVVGSPRSDRDPGSVLLCWWEWSLRCASSTLDIPPI